MTRTSGHPSRRTVIRDGIGVGLATGAYDVSFGALGVTSGLSVAQTCMLSLLLASGASQFALVGVLSAGGAPVTAVVSALLLGTRNTLYGLRLAPLLRLRGLQRLLGAQLVLDETTAMAISQRHSTARAGGLLVHRHRRFHRLERRDPGRRAWRDCDRGPTGLRPGRRGGRGIPGAALARLDGSGPWIAATLAVTVALATVPVLTSGLPVLVAGVVALLIARRPPSQEAAKTWAEQP